MEYRLRKQRIAVASICAAVALFWASSAETQDPPRPTLAERLGYPAEAKLLIVHADDLGLCNSVNQASFEALKTGMVSSASIMVPCPWTPQVAAEAKTHPEWDLGIHLTMNAEWEVFKWGPVAPQEKVLSLIDPAGYLYSTSGETVEKASPDEAETEIRSQIERARGLGIEPTHLDSHMGTLFRSPELLERMLKVAREYRLPLMLPRNLLGMAPYASELLTDQDVLIDGMISMYPGVEGSEEGWRQAYERMISGLQPGVHQLIVHLGYDDSELRAVTVNHPDFGSGWRQRDFDYVTSEAFARLIEREGIRLLKWREIGALLR